MQHIKDINKQLIKQTNFSKEVISPHKKKGGNRSFFLCLFTLIINKEVQDQGLENHDEESDNTF